MSSPLKILTSCAISSTDLNAQIVDGVETNLGSNFLA